MKNYWVTIGSTLAALAVVCGAFGAHGLEKPLQKLYPSGEVKTIAGMEVPASWKYLEDFKTAAEYQMYHAFGLIVVGLLSAHRGRRPSLSVAGWCFLLGIVLFSGSLYVLVLTGMGWLGAIAPIGGTLFIVGWGVLAYAGCPCTQPQTEPVPLEN